eukprot:3931841-Rhodomonas_salina.1
MEHAYYASNVNGASVDYEDIHDYYISSFQKKNSKAKLFHKDHKVYLLFTIASTLTEKSYGED